jgi:antitoxin CptB
MEVALVVSSTPITPPAFNRGRLRWRCRRGMRELDVLLEGYLSRRFDMADAAEQAAFLYLLEQEDPDIWAWLVGQAQPPRELADVILRLQHQP